MMLRSAICLFFCTNLLHKIDANNNTLELVHLVFRHGDRTPDFSITYPTDPHKNVTFDVGQGQLTNKGKNKLFQLGKALRKRYWSFLGSYTPHIVEPRSTDSPRTKASLQIVLTAMFPPEDTFVWRKGKQWQAIPYTYSKKKHDHVLYDSSAICPRFIKLYLEYLQSPDGVKARENYTEVEEYLRNNTGSNVTTSRLIWNWYYTMLLEEENGLPLPSWTKPIYPEILKKLMFLEYDARSATLELKKLSTGGFLLKKMIRDTNRKIKGMLSPHLKMFLYSGHEYVLIYLMKLLGIYYPHSPPYCAYIAIEIHNTGGERIVKAFYQDYETRNPKRMKIPGCGDDCPFKKFVEMYKMYLPKSKQECEV